MSNTLQLAATTVLRALAVGIAGSVLYWIARCIYRLYLHPLAQYPGPRIAAVSELWWAWMFTSGRGHQIMLDAHRKYGDVLRVGPNQLSFCTLQSYQDMYGHVTKGQQRFLKTEFYQGADTVPRITTARDPEVHARQRKSLSHAFSAKALRDQEVVVHEYVDLFIKQVAKIGGAGDTAIDASEAYNWLTFDIIGDLAFGESFNAVADARNNFWISTLVNGNFYSVLTSLRQRLPLLAYLLPFIMPKDSAANFASHKQLSLAMAQKRMSLGADTQRGLEDFFGHMIRNNTITEIELMHQARTLILAGSETTATTLTAVTYYLLRKPECLTKLQHEIRTKFTALDQITNDSTIGLPYLHGVIEEGLRLFPPVPIDLPRYSPGALVDGHYVPAGVTVGGSSYEMGRDPRYWHEPDSFLPERWIGEGFHDEKKANLPFSTGPRGCLGINLAYLEMRVILAKVIFAYDFELVSTELKEWTEECKLYALWTRPELMVKFHPVVQV